jgi:hypothetical protein
MRWADAKSSLRKPSVGGFISDAAVHEIDGISVVVLRVDAYLLNSFSESR